MSFTVEQADELTRLVRESVHPGFAPNDGTLQIEIRPMADGSGDWGVFVTIDVAGSEEVFRHVVDAAGVSRETLLGERPAVTFEGRNERGEVVEIHTEDGMRVYREGWPE